MQSAFIQNCRKRLHKTLPICFPMNNPPSFSSDHFNSSSKYVYTKSGQFCLASHAETNKRTSFDRKMKPTREKESADGGSDLASGSDGREERLETVGGHLVEDVDDFGSETEPALGGNDLASGGVDAEQEPSIRPSLYELGCKYGAGHGKFF